MNDDKTIDVIFRAVRFCIAIMTLLPLTPVFGETPSNKQDIVFEHGRWEVIGCKFDGHDCSREQRAHWTTGTGPISTSSSIEKKIDEIQCYRQERLCVIASAGNASDLLYAGIQKFFVTKWDEHGVEANWTNGNADGSGELGQKLSISFASSGVDSVILDDSLNGVPKGQIAKDHLVRYQLVHDSNWHHF